jgi:hypothetical protein
MAETSLCIMTLRASVVRILLLCTRPFSNPTTRNQVVSGLVIFAVTDFSKLMGHRNNFQIPSYLHYICGMLRHLVASNLPLIRHLLTDSQIYWIRSSTPSWCTWKLKKIGVCGGRCRNDIAVSCPFVFHYCSKNGWVMISLLSCAYASHLPDFHENLYEDHAICYEAVLYTRNKNIIYLLPFSPEPFDFSSAV